MQELVGSEQSALTVATAIAAGETKPDVAKLLLDTGLQHAEDAFCPTNEVFQALYADGAAAKKLSHTPFTYIELANQSLLPEWLPPDSAGERP